MTTAWIASADYSHRAELTDTPRGVLVTLWRIHPPRTCLGTWHLDASWHVVVNKVYDIVRPMTVDGPQLGYDDDLRRVVLRSYSRSNHNAKGE